MLRLRLLGPIALAAFAACGGRAQPYRFASPMLGTAALPPEPLYGPPRREPPPRTIAEREPPGVRARPIRAASAPRIREASAAAAAAVVERSAAAREETRAALPAPHLLAGTGPLPAAHSAGELRSLVGHRDAREPTAAVLGWAHDLGLVIDAASVREVIAWADRTDRLAPATARPERGDLLVFDRAVSDEPADLLAIVIGRDERDVTEFLFLGGGVIRRGFVDANRPNVTRDDGGAVVNTFLRTGKRWPPKGTRYLAGELLAHVIHAR